MKKLHKNIFWQAASDNTNLGCVIGEDGVVCIDLPQDPDEARTWRAQIAEFSDKPIRAVMFTSSDRLNSEALAVIGAPAILHDSAFAQMPMPAEPMMMQVLEPSGMPLLRDVGATPHVTFSRSATFVLGVKQTTYVDIVHQGGYSTDASFVIPRGSGIAFTGDHVAVGQPPLLAQGHFEQWQAVLAALKKNKAITTVVPGRGAPGDPAAAADETLDYIKTATTRVKALVRANRSRSDAAALASELVAIYMPKAGRGAHAKTATNLDAVYRQARAGLERIYDDLKVASEK
jgi:hypothetical protein